MAIDEKSLSGYSVARTNRASKAFTILKYSLCTYLAIYVYLNFISTRDSLSLSPEQVILNELESNHAGEWLQKYTDEPSLTGTAKNLADWTKLKFEEYGASASIDTYEVYLSFPHEHDLSLLDSKTNETLYKAPLEEDELSVDPASFKNNTVPTFLGYAANGNVTAEYVYVNYGTKNDFEELKKLGVDVNGKIAIARYGAIFRGLKVKFAQDNGAIGVLLYSDPGDDHGITPANGYKQYPEGPARNDGSVQRGSAQFLGGLGATPGDPTTPGYPSQGDDIKRSDPHQSTGKIPVLPISYREIKPILAKLNGKGAKSPKKWVGELEGYDYSIGPNPKVQLNLYNNQIYNITPIWNVYGEFEGESKDEVILIGNHRDAWVTGASDPHSGSAVLIEVARALGKLKESGYKFKRTIRLASWDGEEQGLLGLTEAGENYSKEFQSKVIAYLNLDSSVSGQHLKLSASPVLNKILKKIASNLLYPKESVGTLLDHFNQETGGKITNLGSGSDYTVFLEHLGIPSVDLGFGQGKGDPIYQYHSSYDSYYWISKFADPGFVYHNLAAKYLSLLIFELNNHEVIEFGLKDYSSDLYSYFNESVDLIPKSWFNEKIDTPNVDENEFFIDEISEGYYFNLIMTHGCHNKVGAMHHHKNKTLSYLVDSIYQDLNKLYNTTVEFDLKGESLQSEYNNRNNLHWWQKIKLHFEIKHHNKLLQYYERNFLYHKGLDGREWFKHIVFASGRFTGYAGQTWPGLREAIEDGDFERLVKWLTIVSKTLKRVETALF